LAAASAVAQQAVSRADAVASAIARGPRLAVAHADSALAAAGVVTSRAYPNPTLLAEYTKSTPQYHVTVEFPFDYLGFRSARISAAEAANNAARLRYQFERAAVSFEAETTYSHALVAQSIADLSRRNARDADSLLRIAERRRDAGDASELDVQLALVNAGQQANLASEDSIEAIGTLLELQSLMGLDTAGLVIRLSDTLAVPPTPPPEVAPGQLSLSVAAAQYNLRSADFFSRAQHKSIFATPGIQAGFETHDPSGDESGILPTIGFSIPLPLLNRNRGPIMEADAQRERARAEVALAIIESRREIARGQRERAAALARLERDQRLLIGAQRVGSMSLIAYQEGAASLANVIESQRLSREVLAQYAQDLGAAWNTTAALRLFTLSVTPP